MRRAPRALRRWQFDSKLEQQRRGGFGFPGDRLRFVGGGRECGSVGGESRGFGAGSVAGEANSVSVGSAGNERTITNVAPGVNPTDAVNMLQLNSVQDSVNSVARTAYSGIAAATALTMIPEVDPGKTLSVGIGMGGYQGYSAVAIGFTARIAANLKVKGVSARPTRAPFTVQGLVTNGSGDADPRGAPAKGP
jgi:hypothetical protein